MIKILQKKGILAIHININTDTGKGQIVEHGSDGKTSKTDTSCYLTIACMRYLKENFDDNCYELKILRWFRDKYVSEEDIKHYYAVAPIIVDTINKTEQADTIYNYIYKTIVLYSVKQILQGNYNNAYNRYKNTVLLLEEKFTKPFLQQQFVNILKK